MRTKGGDLFQQAYSAAFVEDDKDKAIDLCRRVLESDPLHHTAKMLLGTLLADSDSPEEREEARQHFILAIQNTSDIKNFYTGWAEENPIFHLGLWEMNRNSPALACLFFMLDALLDPSEDSDSRSILRKLLQQMDPIISSVIENLIARIRKEYKSVRTADASCNESS